MKLFKSVKANLGLRKDMVAVSSHINVDPFNGKVSKLRERLIKISNDLDLKVRCNTSELLKGIVLNPKYGREFVLGEVLVRINDIEERREFVEFISEVNRTIDFLLIKKEDNVDYDEMIDFVLTRPNLTEKQKREETEALLFMFKATNLLKSAPEGTDIKARINIIAEYLVDNKGVLNI